MSEIYAGNGLVWGVAEDGRVRWQYRTEAEAQRAAQVFGSYEGSGLCEVAERDAVMLAWWSRTARRIALEGAGSPLVQ